MAYFIALGLIAFGLVIAIPAYFTWIDLVTGGDIAQAFEEAGQVFKQLIIGGLITVTGIGVLIWKALTSRRQPTISVRNSSGVIVTSTSPGGDAIVRSTIKDLQQSTNTDIKNVVNLLLELKTAIDTEPNFSPESKAEALEQVNAIGEAAKESSEDIRKYRVKSAIRVLKGMVTEMPKAAKFISICDKVLPEISSLLC
ncbi:MAG: hypothetical protein AB4372_01125 [Xenococcus sp. (in: cyanobacteria)]